MEKPSCTVAQRFIMGPDGQDRCWVVTADEGGGTSQVIFSGFEAAARAVAYARANFGVCHFSMVAEPGQYAKAGADLGSEAAH